MTKFNADSIVKAIAAATEDKTQIDTVIRVTGGERLTDKNIASLHAGLTTYFVQPFTVAPNKDDQKAKAAATKVDFLCNLFRAAPELPGMVKSAQDFFAKKGADDKPVPRKGNVGSAVRAQVNAWVKREDTAKALAVACPELSPSEIRAKKFETLRKTLREAAELSSELELAALAKLLMDATTKAVDTPAPAPAAPAAAA